VLTSGNETKWQIILRRCKKAPYYLIPRINSGNLALDGMYLMMMLLLQETFLPFLLNGARIIDLITPWLILNIVVQTQWRATSLAFFAAIIQETNTAFPAGTYLASYWIIVTTVFLVKPTLSWRHSVPWLVTLALGLLWTRLFEIFIIVMTRASWSVELSLVISAFATIVVGTIFGLHLARHPREAFAHEEADS